MPRPRRTPRSLVQGPKNKNAKIWRFVNLPKFLDFVHTGSLYFGRLDKLEDPYEGLPPLSELKMLRSDATTKWMADLFAAMNQTNIYVNSWYMSEHEPAAMWKLYAGVDAGIALCSTYARLAKAVEPSPHRIEVGVVRYGQVSVNGTTTWEHAMCKRHSFEHEREVRAVIPPAHMRFSSRKTTSGYIPTVSSRRKVGIKIPVRINDLVTEVVISPTSPPWFLDALVAVSGKFGLKVPIRQSKLYTLDHDNS
jgi:hypothetical protein